jgi:CRISPR-associated endonuclease/helicase Cas3
MGAPHPVIANAWAKAVDSSDGRRRFHSVVGHGTDVAAVFETLCSSPIFTDRLARAAGRPLKDADVARLSVFAFLHDFGKVNRGFWGRQFERGDKRRERDAGHIGETHVVLSDRYPQRDHVMAAIGFDRMERWGDALWPLLVATLSHHGTPVKARLKPEYLQAEAALWRPAHGYDPMAELARLRDAAFAMFPEASSRSADPLPLTQHLIHLFGGLLMLADWIGSDPDRFPLADGADDGRPNFARKRARELLADFGLAGLASRLLSTVHGFEHAFQFAPRPLQAALDVPTPEPLTILEAETGSGKTEAALWHFVRLLQAGSVDSLYFALPTRVAASEIHGRVIRAANALFGADVIKPVLAVPGYVRAGSLDGQKLPGYVVLWPDRDEPTRPADGRWAAESSKRFLGAPIAVGTIDQALMAGLQIGHAHLRGAALSRSLLVVDEVHASDLYMASILKQVLTNHLAVGGRALLMSATLGATARVGFTGAALPSAKEAALVPYPAISHGSRIESVPATGRRKQVTVRRLRTMAHPQAVAERAAAAAREGATVVVVRNTVRDALATQEALEQIAEPAHLFRVQDLVTLHHGRFAPEDRRLLDAEVTRLFGKSRDMAGRIVIGTQTLEQSLDIDADILITDLCPMDVLLQRLGRLHRHDRERPPGYAPAVAEVLVPENRDFAGLLLRQRHGLGHNREGGSLCQCASHRGDSATAGTP